MVHAMWDVSRDGGPGRETWNFNRDSGHHSGEWKNKWEDDRLDPDPGLGREPSMPSISKTLNRPTDVMVIAFGFDGAELNQPN